MQCAWERLQSHKQTLEHIRCGKRSLRRPRHRWWYIKAVPLPSCRRQGGRKYGFYSFLTSALDGVSGRRYTSAVFYFRYLLDRRLGGPQSRSGYRG
jgi:hypothetical protein